MFDTFPMLRFSPTEVLQLVVLLQSGLLATFLLQRRRLWPLAGFLAALAVQMGWQLAGSRGLHTLPELGAGLDFLYGPLMLALVRHLSQPDRPSLGWPHVLPALLVPILLRLWPALDGLVWIAVGISASSYMTLGLHELKRYRHALRATRSSFEAHNLDWLRHALWGLLGVVALDVLRVLVRPWLPDSEPWLIGGILLSALGFLYFLIWHALQQPHWFARIGREDVALAEAPVTPVLDARGEPALAELARQLSTHLQAARPHLDPELTVQALAAQLGWPAKQLSAVINQQFGRNFNDLINAERVATACALLADPVRKQDKLIAIQLDAGFASRSVFNAAFKRETGQTPSAWRQAHAPAGGV